MNKQCFDDIDKSFTDSDKRFKDQDECLEYLRQGIENNKTDQGFAGLQL